jgi:hypothetical protein
MGATPQAGADSGAVTVVAERLAKLTLKIGSKSRDFR